MYGEEKVSFEQAIEIFKSRITDLGKFEEYSIEDIERIEDSRSRAGYEMSKKTLNLNKKLLASNMLGLTDKLS